MSTGPVPLTPFGTCLALVAPSSKLTPTAVPPKCCACQCLVTCPQTSQASGYKGMGMVIGAIRWAARFFCDCLDVVKAVNGVARRALDPRSKYAGIILTTHSDPGKRRLAKSVSWIKAHRAASGNEAPDVARDIRGNASADEAAKAAARLHPPAGVDAEASIAYHSRRAPHVVAVVIVALELFPRASKEMGRPPRLADEKQARERKMHHWAFSAGAWRCTLCHDFITAPKLPWYRARQTCRGRAPADDAAAYAVRGHRLCKADSAMPIVFCSQCGAWGNRRTRKLRAACTHPTRAGAQALKRIARGWHPMLQKGADGRVLPRMRLEVAAAYDQTNAEWRPLGGGPGPRGDQLADVMRGLDEQELSRPPAAADSGGPAATTQVTDALMHDPTDLLDITEPLPPELDMPSDEDVFGFGGGLNQDDDMRDEGRAPLDNAATTSALALSSADTAGQPARRTPGCRTPTS